MRKDAARNREKLVAAASAIMRSEGGDVPMELIAERAGLTRGTLYRNFPHRQAVYEAVLENDLRDLADQLAAESEAAPLSFIRRLTELMSVYDKFLVALAAMPDYDATKNQERMAAAIAAPLAAAQRQGLLLADLTGEDVLMASRMLASHLLLDNPADPEAAFTRRLELLMRGLGPGRPGASAQPIHPVLKANSAIRGRA
ncbi:TetR/AcrR family transcriptional regulator [Lichenicoccus sp.]|uniref:TetR/AcrR family transcriptional regulator n=1 Tax=Lichenicoccus sp. TaxID=2781899 RepID=UPI003D13BD43